MIIIVDYGMGNIGSIRNILKKAGSDCVISSFKIEIENATKLILPGVGAFDKAMQKLKELDLIDVILKRVIDDNIPILGICLGMQLMCVSSEEGILPGLGLVDGFVKRFNFSFGSKLKIPHMGWNTVNVKKGNPLIPINNEEQRFYFVHSYHAICNNEQDILTTTDYGYNFVSSFSHNNIFGVQFHPEKSHRFGLNLFKKFLEL